MRDVSKILSDAEVLALRQILSQQNLAPVEPGAFAEYPKVLYVEEFITLSRLIKDHPDPVVKKEARQKLPRTIVIVTTFEEEEEYLEDGWRTDPNEFVIEMNLREGVSEERADPRRPGGREGRMAARDLKSQRAAELRSLKRRYLELTGQRIERDDVSDEPEDGLGQAMAAEEEAAPTPTSARTRRPLPAAITHAAQKAARPRSARA